MSKLQHKVDKLLQSESLYSKKTLLIPLLLPASLVVILTIFVQLWYLITPSLTTTMSFQPTPIPLVETPKPTGLIPHQQSYYNADLRFGFDYPDFLTVITTEGPYGSLLNLHIEDAKTNSMHYGPDVYRNKYFSVSLSVYPQTADKLPELFAQKSCVVVTAANGVIDKDEKAKCEQRVLSSLTPYSNGDIGGYSGTVQGFETEFFVVLFNQDGNRYELTSYGYEGTPPTAYSNRLLSEIVASIKFRTPKLR